LHVASPGWQPSAAQSSAHFDAVAATSSKENVAAFNIKAVMAGDRSFDLKFERQVENDFFSIFFSRKCQRNVVVECQCVEAQGGAKRRRL